ncbi:MAG: hypothetical protein WCL19_08540 [Verrucomicrobiota bacterium]
MKTFFSKTALGFAAMLLPSTLAAFPQKTEWAQKTTSVDGAYLLKETGGLLLTNSHYSRDGNTWNAVQYPNHSYWINCSGYGAGTFVMTGAVGQIFTSIDYKNWITRNPGGEDITDVCFGNNIFIARKFWSKGYIWVSKNNGASWVSVDTGGAPDRFYDGITFGNGKFLYPIDNRTRTSVDGLTWTNYVIPSVPAGFEMRNAHYFNGSVFIGAAETARSGSSVVITTANSANGSQWSFKQSTINSSSTAKFYSTGVVGGNLMITSGSAPAEVWMSSNQGDTWTKIDGPWATSDNASAFFASNGTYVALATDKGIYSALLRTVLSFATSANGTIAGAGDYAAGASATLTATPSPGYVFTGWTGAASGTQNPLSIVMDADKSVGATFAPDTSDSDGDGLSNYDEIVTYHTNPLQKDTDGDGFDDLFEINTGFNPALASSSPDAASSIRTAMEFRFNAGAGLSYRIESSTDLQNWTTQESAIVGSGGVVTRFYTTENLPKRYFRVRRN